MPSPAEQQRIYTRLRETFGPQWAEQNWSQFAQLLNDPSVGAAGVDEFLSQAEQARQSRGLDMGSMQFQPKAYGVGDGQRELEAAGIAEDAPQLQQQLIDLANTPGGASIVSQFQPELERAAEGGFDETEQAALQRMIQGVQQQMQAQQDDPESFGAERGAQAFYDPYTAQTTPPGGEALDNDFLGYMDPQHLQDYYNAAVSGASSQDIAGAQLGTNPTKDTIGDIMASRSYQRQQAQQTLQNPDATAAEKQQAQASLDEMGGFMPQMVDALNYLGPGSSLDLPGGFDTKDLTAPELTAALQTGGFQQVADPRRWLKGGLGAMAARALMPDMARSPAAENILHGDETSTGFGAGGYYAAPTEDQARENAMQAINAWEMRNGQEMDPQTQATMVQQYLSSAQRNQGLDDERTQGFIQNMTDARPAEQAEALLPQAIGRPADFAQQARAMDVGNYRLRRAPHALQGAARRPMGALGSAARRAGGGFGQAIGRLGPMGLATGALSAAPIAQSQANIAASGTGGPSLGTEALGYGAGGLSMLSTEAALPQAMQGAGQIAQASGVSSRFGALGRAITPQGLQNAGRAASTAFNTGRVSPLARTGATGAGRIGQGAGNMWRGMTAGARNMATAPGRAIGAARAAFSPAARAAAQAAPRAITGGAQMGRLAQLGGGLKNLGGGAILAQAGLDAALNTGDAYTAAFGGQRGRQMVQQGNRALADKAGQRGFWGNVAAAPNVVSQSRAMMGLNQQTNQANRRATNMSMQGAQFARQNAQRQAFEQAAQEAGIDPSDYLRVQRDMAGDESFFNEYLQADPSLQQAHDLYQQTTRDQSRRRGQAGFNAGQGQELTDYVHDTGGFMSRAFGGVPTWLGGSGGGNSGASRSMEDIYQGAPEELQQSMRQLGQAVERGDISAQEASQYLNLGASNDKDELLGQMRAAGIL